MAFVAAYDKRTGVKHSVPEHWVDHPVLGKNLSRTPKSKAAEKKVTIQPLTGDDKKENDDAPRPR